MSTQCQDAVALPHCLLASGMLIESTDVPFYCVQMKKYNLHRREYFRAEFSPCMFHRSRDKFPVNNSRLEHLRDRLLGKYTLLLALYRKVDVDAAAFRRGNFHTQALLR